MQSSSPPPPDPSSSQQQASRKQSPFTSRKPLFGGGGGEVGDYHHFGGASGREFEEAIVVKTPPVSLGFWFFLVSIFVSSLIVFVWIYYFLLVFIYWFGEKRDEICLPLFLNFVNYEGYGWICWKFVDQACLSGEVVHENALNLVIWFILACLRLWLIILLIPMNKYLTSKAVLVEIF